MQLVEGLYVMVGGMGLVFLSLTVLMFAMMGLERAFRVKTPGEGDGAGPAPTASESKPTAPEPKGPPMRAESAPLAKIQPEVAAAILCALARARAAAVTAQPVVAERADVHQWDWLWEEGIDDYGTTRGSHYANL